MNRRDFLVRMLGASAATLVLSRLDVLAVVPEPCIPQAELHRDVYEAVHHEAWRLFSARLDAMYPYRVVPRGPSRLGDTWETVMLRHQLCVSATASEHAILPAMAALAYQVERYGLDVYGQPNTDLPGARYAETIGPLRMIVVYDIQTDTEQVRFDVLGGSSSLAEQPQRVKRQQALKARILKRRQIDPRMRMYA